MDLSKINDADLRAELKRREDAEKQRLEKIRQEKTEERDFQHREVLENIDRLLDLFTIHEPGYRNQCSDAEPADIDMDDENLAHRCGRCVLLHLSREGWMDIDINCKIMFERRPVR